MRRGGRRCWGAGMLVRVGDVGVGDGYAGCEYADRLMPLVVLMVGMPTQYPGPWLGLSTPGYANPILDVHLDDCYTLENMQVLG
jgi:hypothetical protein